MSPSKPRVPSATRRRYRPSGGIHLERFSLWALLTLAVSAAFGFLLHLAYVHDHYYAFVLVLLAAFLVGGMVLLAVRHGHCRSPAAAVLLGLAAATVLYPGFYALGLYSAVGTFELRELLPYVRWRMESQRLVSGGGSTEEETQPDKMDVGFNWVILAGEAATVLFFCVPLGWIRVRRDPYCERCGAWARRELLLLPADKSEDLVTGLEDGTFAEMAVERSMPFRPNVAAIVAAIDVCPRRLACRGDVSAWVSLKVTTGQTSPDWASTDTVSATGCSKNSSSSFRSGRPAVSSFCRCLCAMRLFGRSFGVVSTSATWSSSDASSSSVLPV